MADKYTSDNLYVDEIINFEYVVNPDKDDDLDLYEYAKELRNTKFEQVLIPFKFNMGQEGGIDDYFVFTKEYDNENSICRAFCRRGSCCFNTCVCCLARNIIYL